MTPPILLAVPNVSDGRDAKLLNELAQAATAPTPTAATGGRTEPSGDGAPVRLLDMHSDRDHHRAVFTLAGRQRALADSLLRFVGVAIGSIDVVARAGGDASQAGAHPHVGVVDVVPLVYLDASARGAACAEALVVADRLGEQLGVPVLLYGELAHDRPGRTRAELRRGGVTALAARIADGSVAPDFGPHVIHPSAGATLVAAREPLVAFNLQLRAPATVDDARRIAALVREGGEQGMPGLRAIAVQLAGGVAQVSMNVERPLHLPLAEIVERVASLAPLHSAELVGLAPRAALDGFPADLPMPGFDAARHVIERALSLAPGAEPLGC
ncbi:MAG TPA: hypothetical protein VHT25_13240 [Solirubrobacteraceae bacterium]|nr:hypothetical protein [Solirubrobacteraceae bacterium]